MKNCSATELNNTTTTTRGFINSDGTWVQLASTQVKFHCLQVTQIKLSYDYNKSWNEAAAWIDYFVITIPRTLKYYGSQKIIRTKHSQLDNNTRFQISNYEQNQSIWNISNHLSPAIQELEIQGNNAYFIADISKFRKDMAGN